MYSKNQKGQNTIEYLLLFTVLIAIMIIAVHPKGRMTWVIKESLEEATQGIECMADNTCYEDSCEHKYAQCQAGKPLLEGVPPDFFVSYFETAFEGTQDYMECSQCGGSILGTGALPSSCAQAPLVTGTRTCQAGYFKLTETSFPVTCTDPAGCTQCSAPFSPRILGTRYVIECAPPT
jgi:hypothetical protein